MSLKRLLLLVALVFAMFFVAALLVYAFGIAREVNEIAGSLPLL